MIRAGAGNITGMHIGTLNKSIPGSSPGQALDVFSGREFGACPNSLTPNQSLA